MKKQIQSILLMVALVIFVGGLISFTNAKNTIVKEDLIGCWVYKSYKDGWQTFTKKSDFK